MKLSLLFKDKAIIKKYLMAKYFYIINKQFLEQNLNTRCKTLLKQIQSGLLKSKYFGIPALKSPMDFWIYMEIIYELKPDVVIEIGNFNGGGYVSFSSYIG